jgi:hypothetical protein
MAVQMADSATYCSGRVDRGKNGNTAGWDAAAPDTSSYRAGHGDGGGKAVCDLMRFSFAFVFRVSTGLAYAGEVAQAESVGGAGLNAQELRVLGDQQLEKKICT